MGIEGTISRAYFREAKKVVPGGVNSPVRACRSVGCDPVFIERAEGPFIFDVDGKGYVDYVCSWGPMILGHGHPEVKAAISAALDGGSSFGAPTWREVALAQKIADLIPSIEQVRLVNSGTEATMSAIRLARGFTGRKKILKFEGCYHGHGDSFLVKAGSGLATFGIPGSPGVPDEVASLTIAIPFNDTEALERVLDKEGHEIAALIVEPIPANMGVVPPREGFLEKIRAWTREKGIVLVFDEVITGFRIGLGGAQAFFDVMPDLTCLGKIIGGGLPVGAYGGRREIMEQVSPVGPVYQAGTLSGNPLATAAGLATLDILSRPGTYEALEERAALLEKGLAERAESAGVPCHIQRMGSMMTGFFGQTDPVVDFATALASDTQLYAKYYRGMLDSGIFLAPSQFEAAFVSLAHDGEIIESTLDAAETIFQELAGGKD